MLIFTTENRCWSKTHHVNNERSGMPAWLFRTLSTLPPRHPLAVASSSLNNSLIETSEESPLLSFHESTSPLENSNRKTARSRNMLSPQTNSIVAPVSSTKAEQPRHDEDTPFAFAPPPISLNQNQEPQDSALLTEHTGYGPVTSTPPWRTKDHGALTPPRAKVVNSSDELASDCAGSSLFNTSISPILLSRQSNTANRPNSRTSYLTVSPPNTAFTLASGPAVQKQPTLPLQSRKDDALSEDQILGNDDIISSSADPFGATWSALLSSKTRNDFLATRPFTQRRFFFANSYPTEQNAQLAPYLATSPQPHSSLQPSTIFPSRMPQYAWSPSFPEAKVPNHRHALPPAKSQLRNNFLGAKRPLITPAAIEAATASADQNPACQEISNALIAADASFHVRFRSPTSSPSAVFSETGDPSLLESFTQVQIPQLAPFFNIPDDRNALSDEMCFFYDEPLLPEDTLLTRDTGDQVRITMQLQILSMLP